MTMITPSYLGETIEYSSLHACRSTLEDPTSRYDVLHCIDSAYSPPYGIETWAHRARFRGAVLLMSQSTDRELTGPARATRYAACSEAAAATLAQDAQGPIVVIPNGYDESVFTPGTFDPPVRPVLVWVGRSFDPLKDFGLFADVVEALPDTDAIVVDATHDPPTEIRRRMSDIGPRLRHTALLEPHEMADIYRTAAASGGAFVCTSRSEGFNIAASEAIACECPVVVPRLPGLARFTDGVDAFVYERSDGAQAIVDSLKRLDEPGVRQRSVEEGSRHARRLWASETMAKGYLWLYEDALAAAATAPEERVANAIARRAWRIALRVRPHWHDVQGTFGRLRSQKR